MTFLDDKGAPVDATFRTEEVDGQQTIVDPRFRTVV